MSEWWVPNWTWLWKKRGTKKGENGFVGECWMPGWTHLMKSEWWVPGWAQLWKKEERKMDKMGLWESVGCPAGLI